MPAHIDNDYSLFFAPNTAACVINFQASSLGAAQGAAQSTATIFGRTVILHSHGTGTKYSYTPGSQGGTVSAPAGVGT